MFTKFGIKDHSTLKPHGYVISKRRDIDEVDFEGDTIQCCHCGMHWIFKPGSGRVRGYCLLCNAITCGHPRCDSHDDSKHLLR